MIKTGVDDTKVLSLGIIGTSWISKEFYSSVLNTEIYKVKSIYSYNNKTIPWISDTDIKCFSSFDNFLKSEIDVIYIASPNNTHFNYAISALQTGIHVICEKPLFQSLDQTNQAYSIAEKNNVFLFEAIKSIHIPLIKEMKTKIKSIGKIHSSNFRFLQLSSRYKEYKDGKFNNMFDPSYFGGNTNDLGVYLIHLAIFFFGTPLHYQNIDTKLQNGVTITSLLIFNYDDFTCTLLSSKACNGTNLCEINGEKGYLSINHPVFPSSLMESGEKMKKHESMNMVNNMYFEARDFAQIINNHNVIEYNNLKKQSLDVMSILDDLHYKGFDKNDFK